MPCGLFFSAGLLGDDRGHRFWHDLEGEPPRPTGDVLEISFHPGIEIRTVTRADLPQAGNARLHREPAPMPDVVFGNFLWQWRARSDEAHLAAQHVPELRQLVEAGPAQEPARTRQARIIGHLEGAA